MRQRNEPAVFKSTVGVVLKGDTGDSAYEIAVQNGFVGTKEEWLESLKGEAIKAAAYTEQALQYSNAAQSYAVAAGNNATAAKVYRDEAEGIKESMGPEAESALAAIRAAKSEAQMMKTQVDLQAKIAETNALQTQADAAETRYLYTETIRQKNTATNAADLARRYAEGAMAPTLMYYNREETNELLNGVLAQVDEKDSAVAAGMQEQINASVGSEAERAQVNSSISALDETLRQKIANDLRDYYTKSETYSKSEVDTKISQTQRRRTVVVDSLPATGEEDVIYLVPGTGADSDKYTEYIYVVNEGVGEFIQLGTQSIDLSNYVTKDKIVTMSATQPEYGLWLRPIS